MIHTVNDNEESEAVIHTVNESAEPVSDNEESEAEIPLLSEEVSESHTVNNKEEPEVEL